MLGVRIQANDKDIREIVNMLSLLSDNFSDYAFRVVKRLGGRFRQNVYAAVVKNAPWATANWRPLSAAYVKRKHHARFYLHTGLLHRSLRPNANVLRTSGQGRGDFVEDVMRGLMVESLYPNNKRGLTTYDTFMINEFGTKNQRPPSRPVIMPAFWRTLQMFDLDEEFTGIIRKELPGVFE